MPQITVKPRLMSGPMPQLVKRHTVKMRGALERLEPRQTDEVVAGPVVRFARALADRGTAARQKVVNRRVALLGISVGDLQLLHEVDFGAVLAAANVAAQFQSLLEREITRGAVAGILRHP